MQKIDGKLDKKDVDEAIDHVLSKGNGEIHIIIQDKVIYELNYTPRLRRRREKQPNKE